MSPLCARRRLLDFGHRVQRQPVDLLRTLEDAVHEDERLGPRRGRAVDAADPRLDLRRRDRLDRLLAEDGEQLRVEQCPVAGDGRGLAATVMLDVAQPLVCRLGERHVGLDQAGQRPAPRFVQHVAQPGFRRALGEVARAGSAARQPRPGRACAAPGGRQAAGTWRTTAGRACDRPGRRVPKGAAEGLCERAPCRHL